MTNPPHGSSGSPESEGNSSGDSADSPSTPPQSNTPPADSQGNQASGHPADNPYGSYPPPTEGQYGAYPPPPPYPTGSTSGDPGAQGYGSQGSQQDGSQGYGVPPQYGTPQYGTPQDNPPQYGGQQPGSQQYGGEQYGGQQYGGQQYPPPNYGSGQYGDTQYGGGSYPPPPPGGEYGGAYGSFPPPPPVTPMGRSPEAFSVGDAISYGWQKYRRNWATWLLVSLAVIVITGLIDWALRGFKLNADDLSNTATVVSGIVTSIISVLVRMGFTRAALDEIDGRRPGFADFFKFNNLVGVFLTAFLVWIITTIGFYLFFIPGLIATFFLWYALTFAIDQDAGAFDAIKRSCRLIADQPGKMFLLALACVALNIVGAILCFVGLLVTLPLTLIASTYAYRYFTGGVISPPDM